MLLQPFLTHLSKLPSSVRQNQSVHISFYPHLFFCLGELTVVGVWMCECISQWGSMCRVPEYEVLNHITLPEIRTTSIQSQLRQTVWPRINPPGRSKQAHAHTETYSHRHTHILVSQKFMHTQTRIHTHSASSTAFRPLHITTSPEGVCHHTHTYQEYLPRTTVSHTQSAPCEINIQGGMIFPVGGCLFVCPSPPLYQSVANTQCHWIWNSLHSQQTRGCHTYLFYQCMCVCVSSVCCTDFIY